jgi:hypothetical protein
MEHSKVSPKDINICEAGFQYEALYLFIPSHG